MAEDKDVVVLVGDLGYSFFDEFKEKFPNQFINAGIAEQNMIGVSAGLARVGKKPYVYSGAIFLAYRACEQIRDDVAYPNLNVKLIGTGASGFLGWTHNLSEKEDDVGLIQTFPNIRALRASEETLPDLLRAEGPYYIRL